MAREQQVPALTSFTYDARNRLTREWRVAADNSDYDLEYRYDQGGNRTRKIDHLAQIDAQYTYDTSDPGLYGSDNNRLEKIEAFHSTAYDEQGDPIALAPLRW